MELQFQGAAGTVTGSKYLIRNGAAKVLVDCGLFHSKLTLALALDSRSLSLRMFPAYAFMGAVGLGVALIV